MTLHLNAAAVADFDRHREVGPESDVVRAVGV